MKKQFIDIESRGLPGGPNEMFTYITGVFSIDGYKSDSPDVNNPFNIIPSSNITMEGVDFPVRGYGNNGIVQDMKPGGNYNYGDADYVFEVPMAQEGLEQRGKRQIDFMTNWANSSMHNQMLDSSSTSDKFKDKVKRARRNFDNVNIADEEVDGFLGQYINGQITMNPSALKEHVIGNGYDDVLVHELSHFTDDGNPDNKGQFKKSNIPLSDRRLIKDYSKQGIKRAKSEEKELNELLKSENMNPNSKDVIKDRVKRLNYLGDPTETRSRINATRYFYENDKNFGRSSKRNIDKNLPSIFDSEVTPDMIKVMQESGQYKQLQELYTDDQILEMFNTISYSETPERSFNVLNARYGKELPTAQRGGGLLTKTMKCNNCGWKWKAADGGNDVTTCHKCGGEALPTAQNGREQATISAYEEPAWYEKVVDYLASPMTAFGYSARNQDLPDSIPINAENRNAFDGVIDTINPFAWAKYAASAKRNVDQGEYIDAGFDALGAIPIVPAWLSKGKNAAKNLPLDKLDDLVEVVTANGSIKKIPRKDAIRLNRVEDANVTNTSFSQYEDGNWFADELSDFYVNRTKNAMSPVSYDLLDPKDPRRLITMYMDPSDAKNFNLIKGTATERALNMSGGMGNMPHPNEYVLPPALVKQIRETGKIPGGSAFIGDADQVMKNLSNFYKKYGGDIGELDQAQLGAFLKSLKPAIKKGAKYIDEFIQNDLYKYNPFAYNNIDSKLPEFLQFNKENEKWLRQVGEPAIRDAQATGTVREIGEKIDPRHFAEKLAELKNAPVGQFSISKRYPGPFFKKGETFFNYNKKSRPGLDGKRNTRGRSGSADYLIEFDPSDPIKYQGMDSYFQPAYMQIMQLDPKPFSKYVGDIGIMKPKMRGVENFNFYKKDPFWAYKKVPLDKLQDGNGEYQVKKGDTFYGIANRNNISWDKLKEANPNLNIDKLSLGQKIIVPGYKSPEPVVENKPKKEFNPYKDIDSTSQERRFELDKALKKVASLEPENKNLYGNLLMVAAMENSYGANPDSYKRTYTRGPMSIDDIAYKDLFEPRGENNKYLSSQKNWFNYLSDLGFDYTKMDKTLRSNDPLAGVAAARIQYGRTPEALPDVNDPEAMYNYYMKYYNRTEADHKERFMGWYNELLKDKEYGGDPSYNVYKKFMAGGFISKDEEKEAEKVYDKLNRIHYSDAKSLGMSPANYIMTHIIRNS